MLAQAQMRSSLNRPDPYRKEFFLFGLQHANFNGGFCLRLLSRQFATAIPLCVAFGKGDIADVAGAALY